MNENSIFNELKNNNEKFMEDYKDVMKDYYHKMQNMRKDPNFVDEEGGKMITPTPYCCLKTKDKKGQKIFVNFLSHEAIDMPKEENLLEMDNQFGVRMPLSLSEKTEDFDNKNGPCIVYDVIFNPKIIEKAEKEPVIMEFLITLVAQRLVQKAKVEIVLESNKIMKNMKYKGKQVRMQRVRAKKGPKIEEIIHENQTKMKDLNEQEEASKRVNSHGVERAKAPEWNFFIYRKSLTKSVYIKDCAFILENSKELLGYKRFSKSASQKLFNNFEFLMDFDGFNANPKYGNGFVFLISLPLLSRGFGINFNINDNYFNISCVGLYRLDINLPFRVDSELAFTFFDSKTRNLIVFLPFHENDYLQHNESKVEVTSNTKESLDLSDKYLYDVIV